MCIYKIEPLEEGQMLDKLKDYLHLPDFTFTSETIEDKIKEICVAKLCEVVGIKCGYNFKNEYFNVFAIIVGEAVCEKLNFNLHIANDKLRFVKYEHINFVETVKNFFCEDVEEAFLDAFNFIDEHKNILLKIM